MELMDSASAWEDTEDKTLEADFAELLERNVDGIVSAMPFKLKIWIEPSVKGKQRCSHMGYRHEND